ncbi:MAG: hypothetical protein KA795_10415 [Burkholderiaceae bacterium]|nr:hypothetical protein [Burkholderiaceae bacterium]
MAAHRFNVFGRIVVIERHGTRWDARSVGTDGKRAPAGFVIPDFVGEDELEQYLFDLFHENAVSPTADIRRLP